MRCSVAENNKHLETMLSASRSVGDYCFCELGYSDTMEYCVTIKMGRLSMYCYFLCV